jgi:dTMP kinase
MLITFEGIDYSGKSTQAKLLVSRLEKHGKEVIFLREPGGTSISENIRNILLDKEHLELKQITELFLFSAARTQLVSEVILPALQAGKVVVCDRFYDSTTAYQGYGRGINLNDIQAINRIATSETKPHLTFFIDIEIDELFKRQIAAGLSADRMESSGRDFFERVRNGYWKLAEMESGRFIVVSGKLQIDEIHREIWDIVKKQII